MAEIYDIDLVRAIWEHAFNDETIFLSSFYESLENPDTLERYGKKVYDLIKDQNKVSYKARGVIYQNGESDIVNIKSRYMSPFAYGARLDVAIDDRDYVNEAVISATESIKGRKFDVLIGASGEKYVMDTPTITSSGSMRIANNILMYNGSEYASDMDYSDDLMAYFVDGLTPKYIAPLGLANGVYAYVVYMIDSTGKLFQATIQYTKSASPDVFEFLDIEEIESSYVKRKVSLSVNGSQKTEPFITMGAKRITILLSGQATITDEYVLLGNDIVETYVKVASGTYYSVEPIEIPSASKINDSENNYYDTTYPKPMTTNTDIFNTLTYTFVVDNSNTIIKDLYKIARYQTFGSTITHINLVFTILEYDYQFGVLTTNTIKAKLDDLSIVPTNGDILTIKASFKLGAYS